MADAVERAQSDAPNYGPTEAEDRCSGCRFGGGGYCDLYSFYFNPNYSCDSYEEGLEPTGIMIGLVPPQAVAEQLAHDFDGALGAEELHLTLAYLGDVRESSLQRAAITAAVAEVAAHMPPLRVTVGGIGRFSEPVPDRDALYLSIDHPDLAYWRELLVEVLEYFGAEVSRDHGFTPHITLGYWAAGLGSLLISIRNTQIDFGLLHLWWGGEHTSFELQGNGGSIAPPNANLPYPVRAKQEPDVPEEIEEMVEEFDSFFEGFKDKVARPFGRKESQEKEPPKDRSLQMELMWEQAASHLWARGEDVGDYYRMVDLYLDQGQLYALVAVEGVLYRAIVHVDESVDRIAIGEMERITQIFEPVERAQTIVRETADGRKRVVQVAATAVLNRDGEIDSTVLFDSFIRRAKETGQYPIVTFHHQGKKTRLGECDYLARDEYCYIVSYTFDDTPYGHAAARGYARDPSEWGMSIEYEAYDWDMVEVVRDIRIPVYTDGFNTAVSILRESKASALFTAHKVVRGVDAMNDEIFRDLVKLFDGDEELAAEFAEMAVDPVNREVTAGQLIARAKKRAGTDTEVESEDETDDETTDDGEAAAETVDRETDTDTDTDDDTDEAGEEETVERESDEEPDAEPDAEPAELVIDDEVIERVAQTVSENIEVDLDDVLEGQDALQSGLTEQSEALADYREEVERRLDEMDEAIARLQRDEDEKRREWQEDLPRRAKRQRVSYRPRKERSTDEEDDEADDVPDSEKRAQATLAKLPEY